jgi:hypothetical protein
VVAAPTDEWSRGSGFGAYAEHRWASVLPVKNVGPGAALNVTGRLSLGAVTLDIIPTSIAPGERADLPIRWPSASLKNWDGASGTLNFDEIDGTGWQSRFRIEDSGEHRYITTEYVIEREWAKLAAVS